MDHYQFIAGKFHSTIETLTLSADTLAEQIQQAAEAMTASLLAGGKVFVCGNGADNALAQILTSHFLARFEHERPALPALALSTDTTSLAAIATTSGVNDIYSRQLRTFAQAGDVLLCINSGAGNSNLLRAVQTAHQQDMRVLVLITPQDEELPALLQDEDVMIRVDASQVPHALELQLITLHCLCALIDHNLFGTYTQE